MNDIRKQQVKKDADTIEKAMARYTGASGAHFGFIAYATGERQVIAGGNVGIAGMCLGEAIAMLVLQTPGLTEEFIDMVAETAKNLLQSGGTAQ